MTYTCEDCGFVFFRISDVKECPSCAGNHIRPASETEQNALQAYLKKQTAATRE